MIPPAAARTRFLNSPVTPLLIVALAVGAFVSSRLARHGGDPSVFVVAGDLYVDPAAKPASLTLLRGSAGYDGQFCYRLALDPFTRQQQDFGIKIDAPRRRQQRVLYPFLAWLMALGGRPVVVPWTLLAVNCVCLCAMAWLGGRLALAMGRHAVWGIVFPLSASYLLTLTRDLTEIVAGTLALGAVVALERQRTRRAAVILALAVLARETSLLLVAGAAIEWLRRRARRQPATVTLGVVPAPALTWIAWQAWLQRVWGTAGAGAAFTADLGVPLGGLLGLWRDTAALNDRYQMIHFVEICVLVGWALVVAWHLRGSRAPVWIKGSWVLATALHVSLNRNVWVEDWSFLRVFSDAYLLGAIILLGSTTLVSRLALGVGVLAGGWMAFEILLYR